MKFFRKIRQKFLSEKSFTKYLIYAIGEILLIVFGILIALAINNQNLERINRGEEVSYLKNLVLDLESDIETAERTLKTNNRIVGGIDTLIKQLVVKPENKEEQLELLINSIRYTYTYISAEFSETSITQLNSNKGFNIIKNELVKKRIIEYYQKLKSLNQMQYVDSKYYFHQCEETQKEIFKLSLAQEFYVLIDVDFETIFFPLDKIKPYVKRGEYFVSEDINIFQKYYNDVLFYGAAVRSTNSSIMEQQIKAKSLRELIKSEYDLKEDFN